MSGLSTYGLGVFGFEATTESNASLFRDMKEAFGLTKDSSESEIYYAAVALEGCLEELYQKADAIVDGRSRGFKMFTGFGGEYVAKRHDLMKKVFSHLSESTLLSGLILADDCLIKI